MVNKPLISICVKSYNQRKFLKDALDGAVSQMYRPLEIVVSDDGSTDGSWEFIEGYFREHRLDDGVKLVLNRNERNLGNLGNWERVCELASGELLVKADGDDISLPERVSRIAEAWVADGSKALAVCHSGWQIGPNGEGYGRLRMVTATWPMGAAMAYSPELFRRFPKAPESHRRRMDDELYTRRARMLGSVLEMSDRLVKYRLGTGATSSLWDLRSQVLFCGRDSLSTLDISDVDLKAMEGTATAERIAELREYLAAERRRLVTKLALLESKSLFERWRLYRKLEGYRFLSIGNYINFAFVMPRWLGDAMVFAYVFARNAYWRHQGSGE